MIARLAVQLPFYFVVPAPPAQFSLYEMQRPGYRVRFLPPGRSELADVRAPESIELNNAPAWTADVLVIDFIKDDFDRTLEANDPSSGAMEEAFDFWLSRARYVTKGAAIKAELSRCPWRLQYLDDAGNELAQETGKVRGRGALALHFSWICLDSAIWSAIHELDADFEIPVWSMLCLDAQAALPHVGSAVVLGAAALEVFIGQVLDQLARGVLSKSLWDWISDRGDHYKDPSVEEEFDVLLKEFVGHSLKEKTELWDSFLKLKSARNRFVHSGVPKAHGTVIDSSEAIRLLRDVNAIVQTVRGWLPAKHRWPEHTFDLELKMTKALSRKDEKSTASTDAGR